MAKYAELAANNWNNGFRFKAFELEMYGAWGPAAEGCLSEWAQYATAAQTRSSQGWSAPHWAEVTRQWVSVALYRENARVLIHAAERRRHPTVAA